jgi:hypothetical protein
VGGFSSSRRQDRTAQRVETVSYFLPAVPNAGTDVVQAPTASAREPSLAMRGQQAED